VGSSRVPWPRSYKLVYVSLVRLTTEKFRKIVSWPTPPSPPPLHARRQTGYNLVGLGISGPREALHETIDPPMACRAERGGAGGAAFAGRRHSRQQGGLRAILRSLPRQATPGLHHLSPPQRQQRPAVS